MGRGGRFHQSFITFLLLFDSAGLHFTSVALCCCCCCWGLWREKIKLVVVVRFSCFICRIENRIAPGLFQKKEQSRETFPVFKPPKSLKDMFGLFERHTVLCKSFTHFRCLTTRFVLHGYFISSVWLCQQAVSYLGFSNIPFANIPSFQCTNHISPHACLPTYRNSQ